MSKRKRNINSDNTDNETLSLREKFADAVDISKDVILGVPLVSMIGDREVTIENYIGILEYKDTLIRIKCKSLNVRLDGKNLELKVMAQSYLYITGRIKCFSYEY